MTFLKCKIRFIYVGFNCKRKKVGGARRLMAKTILNFHFDYLTTPLMMIRMQEFEHVILESALENVVNKFRRHITIKVKRTELVFIIFEISFHIP